MGGRLQDGGVGIETGERVLGTFRVLVVEIV
jgi:hypothetical protein